MAQWTSCRNTSASNPGKWMVPLPRTCLIPGILVMLPPSAASQSTLGAGFPLTMQSTRPPFTFVNSTRDGGSDTKFGPCISYEALQPATKRHNYDQNGSQDGPTGKTEIACPNDTKRAFGEKKDTINKGE